MLALFAKFVHILLCGVVTLNSVFGLLTGDKEGKIRHAKEDCRAAVGILSDTHLKDNFIRQGMLELGFADMTEAEDKLDAAVFVGDITDHGYAEMYECFGEALGEFDIAKQIIMCAGNHDTWGHDDDEGLDEPQMVERVKADFIKYNKLYTNRDIDNIYYSANVNGYPVIVLGSEGNHTAATVSEAQIRWFGEEMAKASLTGKPIFVFFHHPINQTHGLPYIWEMNPDDPPEKGGIGDASDEILNIIKQYNNVFYISGHLHAGLSNEGQGNAYVSVEKYDGYTLINVPCYMYPDVKRSKVITNGTGYVMEIYDNEVLFRARNFATGTWLTKYDTAVALTEAD